MDELKARMQKMNTLYSVERDGVKVGEFYAARDKVQERMIELILRLKPTATDKWDLWEEPRNSFTTTRTTLKTYAAVKHTDEQGDYYTTYVGDKLFSTKVAPQ